MKNANVIVIFGQSNAEGFSRETFLTQQQLERYSKPFSRTKILLDINWSTRVENDFIDVIVGQGFNEEPKRFGIEIGIADQLAQNSLDSDTFIIKFTTGGTSIYDHWKAYGDDKGILYTRLLDCITKGMNLLKHKGYEPRITNLCFFQGESDSDREEYIAKAYEYNEDQLFKGIEQFCKSDNYLSPNYMFIDAAIADIDIWVHHQIINKAKRDNAKKDIAHRMYLETNLDGITTMNEPPEAPDIAHYDAQPMLKLGECFSVPIIQTLKTLK